jgi:Fic family protein
MRKYEKSHPWLRFDAQLARAPIPLWLMLGEARSKTEHLAGAPLRPDTAKVLHQLFIAKGVLATTAIEGNTLSEEEVRQRIEGTLQLPKSKEYLGKEVDNVVAALHYVWQSGMDGVSPQLSVAEIKEFNRLLLKDLSLEEWVVPGEIRTTSVGVGTYRAPPAEDCEYLLQRMCEWLNGPDFEAPEEVGPIPMAILKAVLAHLYLAWIHPFGDGNGRTARLVELKILVAAGVPTPAAHLLSNHYNITRSEYYRQLEKASKSGGDVLPFIQYAVQGLVDQMRSQVQIVRAQQINVAWRNLVHEHFREKTTSGDVRRRHLILDLSMLPHGVPTRAELALVSPRVAKAYANKTGKTLTRDINELREAGLLLRDESGYRANKAMILAFLPESTQSGALLASLLEKEREFLGAARLPGTEAKVSARPRPMVRVSRGSRPARGPRA